MHRWSQLFIPTLREAPADAEVASHKLLLRAGYIRQLGAGIYSYLFLGNRAINKIVAIVRQEMDTIGQEMHLPALNPREVWEESGRWAGMGDNMFRLKDRKGAELCLAMTHEEVMTAIARSELRSYKQLPQIWYQIQTKFRDEPRPKSGLLRVRQFLMKDAYSFDIDEAGLDESYRKHEEVYKRIFTRCGLEFLVVEADSGAMGGTGSQEFMVSTEAGEDLIASSSSGYAANVEKATSKLAPVADLAPTGDGLPELVHTPGQKTIDEVGAFLGVEPIHQMKTMAFIAGFSGINGLAALPILVLLRGDHFVNLTKLQSVIPSDLWDLMAESEIESSFGSPPGYLGPIGLKPLDDRQFNFVLDNGVLPKAVATDPELIKRFIEGQKTGFRAYYKNPVVVLDAALEGRTNLIAGANKEEYHLRNVTPMRDFKPTLVADVRSVNEGELDPVGGEPLRIAKAVEIGHIFKLGYKYSKSMGATVLNRDGKETTPIMGSYGIGIERILTAAIEQSAAKFAAQNAGDAKASETYALPPSIAPFQVVVTITNVREAALLEAGEKIAADLSAAGIDVLLDDRDERAGVKFKDAELIGVPFRIAVGKKLVEGKVELLNRLTNQTDDIPTGEAVQHLTAALHSV
jgi:prolyl-tRNA synthetase